MAPAPAKRKSDAVDLTSEDYPSKAGRVASSNGHSDASNGQRFGQDVQFIPLSQIAQLIPSTGGQPTGGDEDDAQAADLIQGSQDIDDSPLNDVTLYGRSIRWPPSNVFEVLKWHRQDTHQDRRCPLL
jgi:SWI/SNF-related matrix-associated actin-dependent regulator of chromatin subfamily A3